MITNELYLIVVCVCVPIPPSDQDPVAAGIVTDVVMRFGCLASALEETVTAVLRGHCKVS